MLTVWNLSKKKFQFSEGFFLYVITNGYPSIIM